MKKLKIVTLAVIFVLCATSVSFGALPETLVSAANNGDANAMYELGRAYQKGEGIAKSDVEAAKWFEKAAELDHARALFSLGYMYSEGIGVKWNEKKGYLYYERSAKLGNPAAMNNLAIIYHNGVVIAKDKHIARQWCAKAIKLGCPEASSNMIIIDTATWSQPAVGFEIAKSDDEYYKKSAYTWKEPITSVASLNAPKNSENTWLSHSGFDVAKKARSNDGYMIISKVAKDSEAGKGGMLEGCDLFQIDNMNTKQFSYDEVAQYVIKSAEKKATILVVFLSEDGTTKRLDIKLK